MGGSWLPSRSTPALAVLCMDGPLEAGWWLKPLRPSVPQFLPQPSAPMRMRAAPPRERQWGLPEAGQGTLLCPSPSAGARTWRDPVLPSGCFVPKLGASFGISAGLGVLGESKGLGRREKGTPAETCFRGRWAWQGPGGQSDGWTWARRVETCGDDDDALFPELACPSTHPSPASLPSFPSDPPTPSLLAGL